MANEVERKFFFESTNKKPRTGPIHQIEQGYLANTGGWETRLRRIAAEFFLTLKSGNGLSRIEWEIPISATAWNELWPQTAGHRLVKTRETINLAKRVVEIDRYEGPLAGLVTAEVEFESRATAKKWKVPAGFGPELTWDPRFKNHSLADTPDEVPLTLQSQTNWSYGVLPLIKGPKGPQVLVVSTRNQDRWIFPKGQPERGMSPAEVALMEGREEAGLEGKLIGTPIVLPYYRDTGTTNLLLFPLQVTRLASSWLEIGQRERRVVPIDEATSLGELINLGVRCLKDLYVD